MAVIFFFFLTKGDNRINDTSLPSTPPFIFLISPCLRRGHCAPLCRVRKLVEMVGSLEDSSACKGKKKVSILILLDKGK